VIRVFFWWGVLMGVIGLVGILFFGFADPANRWLFMGVCAFWAGIAALLWITGYGRNLVGGVRALPDASPPVPLLALATVLAAIGAEFGWWLSLLAAGMGLIAISGLVRESRAQRAELGAAREAEATAAVDRGEAG
jgi:hypothetical protein